MENDTRPQLTSTEENKKDETEHLQNNNMFLLDSREAVYNSHNDNYTSKNIPYTNFLQNFNNYTNTYNSNNYNINTFLQYNNEHNSNNYNFSSFAPLQQQLQNPWFLLLAIIPAVTVTGNCLVILAVLKEK